MPISITPPKSEKSPHAEAAAQLGEDTTTETITKTNTETGEQELVHHEMETAHYPVPADKDRIDVSMGFKMPVAEYVMVEFRVGRASDCDPEKADDVYDTNKAWVEERLNALVAEQQAAYPEQDAG